MLTIWQIMLMNTAYGIGCITIPILQMETPRSELLSHLSKVTQPISSRAPHITQVGFALLWLKGQRGLGAWPPGTSSLVAPKFLLWDSKALGVQMSN